MAADSPADSTGDPPVVEILAIGDELVHGASIDTNSAHLARELEALGLPVQRFTVVTDEPAALRDAIATSCARAALVVATGGLGPTEDDRTRAAAAAAAGVELEFDTASWTHIQKMFRARGMQSQHGGLLDHYPIAATSLEIRRQ